MRFSGPVNHPHRPPPPVLRMSWLHLPARPSARYKDAFVPRRFSNNSLPPFSPIHSPHTIPVVPKASAISTFPCIPPPSTERYDAACEKNASARPPVLIRSPPSAALSCWSSHCGSDLDDDAEARVWISRSPATWLCDGLRCRTSAILQAS
jgi:hypothetical protein